MSKPMMGRSISVFILGLLSVVPRIAGGTDALVLSEVRIVGTNQLSSEDVIRGLNLKIGEPTTRQSLLRACDRLRQLKLFRSSQCRYAIHGHSLSLTISVVEKWAGMPIGMPVVFSNFVWTKRADLLSRLKREIPLFMPDLPESCGLTNDIIRVLQQVVNERGIKAAVRYDDSFWTLRGMNVFYIEGISTPVMALQIEGENAPSPEELAKWSQFYTKEDFSAARLTWVIRWVQRDLYNPRGYLRPVVGEPVIHFLGEKEGTYPVRVILPITSGDLYTFDSVRFEGLAKEHAVSLISKWKLRPGDPYDKAYVDGFITNEILSAPWARHSKSESDDAIPCAEIDRASKKVSLTVTVEPPKKTYPGTKHLDDECGAVMKTLTFPPIH
jgi:outer membrane protein assembly factor BamA